jgi:thioredoxin 1
MSIETFHQNIQQAETPVLAYFWAPWCLPCRSLSPLVEQLRNEYGERLQVLKINTDEQPEIIRELNIYGIPTLVLFSGGSEAGRKTGAQPRRALQGWIDSVLSGDTKPAGGISSMERLVRIGAGVALMGLGWYTSTGLLLAVGVLVVFMGVYDRCPIWQMVSGRLKDVLRPRMTPGS